MNLTSQEVDSLEQGFQNGKTHDYRMRCQCILMSFKGKSVPELCEHFGKNHNTIYQWFNRWESEGISGLSIRTGRGRKRKLDFTNSDHIKLVKESLKQENRTVKHLQKDLEVALGFEISKSSLRRFLKKLVTDTNDSENV